jgi:hypothetical protein
MSGKGAGRLGTGFSSRRGSAAMRPSGGWSAAAGPVVRNRLSTKQLLSPNSVRNSCVQHHLPPIDLLISSRLTACESIGDKSSSLYTPTVQNTYVQCFCTAPLGKESRPHPNLRAGLRTPHSLVLSRDQYQLRSHNLGWNLAGIKEWCSLRGCMRCAALGMHDFLWMTKPITLFVPSYRCV